MRIKGYENFPVDVKGIDGTLPAFEVSDLVLDRVDRQYKGSLTSDEILNLTECVTLKLLV